ncbi:MAG: Lsr2 family protein [Actinomycetaceae bacterium]|nr:Lsr2 family protein [Actinomycetaceae bacterium]
MGTRTRVILVDDISGEDAQETVVFGLDGVSYSIDLTTEHAEEMREAMHKWVSHATRTGGRRKVGTGAVAQVSESRAIREWAAREGIKVNARGRIPTEIRNQYLAACK